MYKISLADRCQRVKVEYDFSSYRCPISRVPQGSVLGPSLFLFYLNNFSSIYLTVFLLMLQIKMTLGHNYAKFGKKQDITAFVSALKSYTSWSIALQLPISSEKFCFIKISNRFDYTVSGDCVVTDHTVDHTVHSSKMYTHNFLQL